MLVGVSTRPSSAPRPTTFVTCWRIACGREPVAAQHVGSDAFAFLGKPDQEVLGPDIGMAEVARGREGAGERVLDPRRDADLGRLVVLTVAPALPAALARRLLLDLAAQIVERDLELVENGADDVALGERQQQVLGVDLAPPGLGRAPRRRLQDLHRVLGQVLGPAAAPGRAAAGAGRAAGRPAARGALGGAGLILLRRPAAAGAAAEEPIVVEEIVEQAAAPTEKALERRARALLAGKPPIVDIAEVEGLALAVADDLGANGCGTHVTDVAQGGHGDCSPRCCVDKRRTTRGARDWFRTGRYTLDSCRHQADFRWCEGVTDLVSRRA